jgi:hypothetical protein
MTTVLEPATANTAGAASAATAADPLVRVVKGSLAAEELAALTAVLLARAASSSQPGTSIKGVHAKDKGHMTQAHWQRPERRPDYRSPVSWHH